MTSVIDAERPRAVPTRADLLVFEFKAALLRARRAVVEVAAGERPRRHAQGRALADAPVLAEVRSPLWTGGPGAREFALTAGKIQNLRLAAQALDGVEVPAGATFSFWSQVGRATRMRGFVDGRELREGCLVPSVGGGLCQISNGLYEAALRAGLEVVERHAHSRTVPGSRAQAQRDATVFWNYVDLRFRSDAAFRIEARLTGEQLVVTFRGHGQAQPAAGETSAPRGAANDCTTCAQTTCHLNNPEQPLNGVPVAWLVDARQPEFAALMERRVGKADALFLPTRRFGGARYAWPEGRTGREVRATLAALRRSLDLRGAGQGATLQGRMLAADRRLALAYANRLSHLHTRLVIAQNLLPHLWAAGVLQGRSFDVLMDRLPMAELQARLDAAHARRPESPTLNDFRADPALVTAETEALARAGRLYTAHRGIAALAPEKTEVLDWFAPAAGPLRAGGRTVLFPASALGRKGVYALREALAGLEIDLVVAGAASDGPTAWGEVPVRRLAPGERLDELAAVVLPAIVEHQPRALLRALAAGVPVIATPACGLPDQPGLTLVPEDDAPALRRALEQALATAD